MDPANNQAPATSGLVTNTFNQDSSSNMPLQPSLQVPNADPHIHSNGSTVYRQSQASIPHTSVGIYQQRSQQTEQFRPTVTNLAPPPYQEAIVPDGPRPVVPLATQPGAAAPGVAPNLPGRIQTTGSILQLLRLIVDAQTYEKVLKIPRGVLEQLNTLSTETLVNLAGTYASLFDHMIGERQT